MMFTSNTRLLFITLALLLPGVGIADDLSQREDVQAFIESMVKKHGFAKDELVALFNQAELKPKIIETIQRPAESKPWYVYRRIFMTEERVRGGVEFWEKYRTALERAEKEYGVPPQMIIAIIGVETRYGRHQGNYRILDALTTLSFDYPKRASFFRSELEHFLLLAREEKVDPLSLLGSYAGAMGEPQFMPSSFRAYAVDFDGDGRRDLWDNPVDTIGSVANYFSRHRWQTGQPIVTRASTKQTPDKTLLDGGLKPSIRLDELKKQGVNITVDWPLDSQAAVFELETQEGPEYWVGLHNFYVITRYNPSALYAMAAFELSQAIVDQQQQSNKNGVVFRE